MIVDYKVTVTITMGETISEEDLRIGVENALEDGLVDFAETAKGGWHRIRSAKVIEVYPKSLVGRQA